MIYICTDGQGSMATGQTPEKAYDSLVGLLGHDEVPWVEGCTFYEAEEVKVEVTLSVSKKAVK